MKNKSKNVTLIHNKKKFVFRIINETDEQYLIDQFGSLEEFQQRISPETEFNKFAETLVRTMHYLLITEITLEDFKNHFWKTQEDIAALYYKFGPCAGVTPKMQKAANKHVDENDKLKKEIKELKHKLFQSKLSNLKSVFGR